MDILVKYHEYPKLGARGMVLCEIWDYEETHILATGLNSDKREARVEAFKNLYPSAIDAPASE